MTRHMSERAAKTRIHQLQIEHRAMRDRIIEKTQRRMSEVRENRAAEKVQEREMNTWEFQG